MNQIPSTRHGFLALHLAVFLFGLSGIFGKIVTVPALLLVFFRALFAAGALGLARYFSESECGISRHAFAKMLPSGAFLAIHWVTFFQSIRVSTISIGLLSYASFPVFVTFLEPLCLRRFPTRSDLAVAGTVMLGLVLIVPSFDLGSNLTQGMAWGILSGFSFAALTVTNRLRGGPHSPGVAALGQTSAATLLLLPFAVASWQPPTTQDIVLLMFLAILCTAVAHTLFIRALQSVSARTASITAGLEAVYGVLFAFLIFHEVPSLRMILGGVLILGSTLTATLIDRSERLSATRDDTQGNASKTI